ncbi:MAG: Gfo/Idh/MocA family oxidoreductase, partial [Halobacteriota archaeon]|nr:Gfo/Idh/MocA family oxidoreductase [Halobacteriota archaeon]
MSQINFSLKIGVVGIGTIGRTICKAVDEGTHGIRLAAIYDIHKERTNEFIPTLKNEPTVVEIDEMVDLVDLVVECASQKAVKSIAIPTLKRGKNIMIMSV